MKRMVWVVVGVLALSRPAAADHYLQAESRDYPTAGVQELELHFPVGSLQIEGDEGNTIRVAVRVRCKRGSLDDCEERAQQIVIDRHATAGKLRLEVEGLPKRNLGRLEVTVNVLVPRRLATRVEMGVGQLSVTSMSADLDLDLGVGELDVRGVADHYGTARAEVGVGDATIRGQGTRSHERGFIGHTSRWQGDGSKSIHAHVGVGEADIILR